MPKQKNIVDLAKDIGKSAQFTVVLGKRYRVAFPVIIKNVEIIYGQPNYTIEPIGGMGQARVNGNLRIDQ